MLADVKECRVQALIISFFGGAGVPATYLGSAILASLASVALCEISKLGVIIEPLDFESIPLRHTVCYQLVTYCDTYRDTELDRR